MGEPAECFAWFSAENLDRDECSDATPGDRDWNGECLDEMGSPAVCQIAGLPKEEGL